MSKDKINLSPKHGLNPAVEQCFICMQDKGVILFGKLPGDAEAPRVVCIPEAGPCDACAAYMRQGIILISVDLEKTTDPKNPHRSGGWCVVTEEALGRIGLKPEALAGILKSRVAFLPDDVWKAIGLPTTPEECEAINASAVWWIARAVRIEREERQHARTMALMDEHSGGTESHSVGLSGDDD